MLVYVSTQSFFKEIILINYRIISLNLYFLESLSEYLFIVQYYALPFFCPDLYLYFRGGFNFRNILGVT